MIFYVNEGCPKVYLLFDLFSVTLLIYSVHQICKGEFITMSNFDP
jgi:hypothetical protein